MCWTTDREVPGSNLTFLHPSFREGLFFPLLNNSKSVRYLSRESNLKFQGRRRRSGHGRTGIYHILIKLNSLLSQNSGSYCLN